MKKTGHDIYDRLAELKVDYVEGLDPNTLPTDPDKFLEFMWDTQISNCQNCLLCKNRTTVVKWDGAASADIMVILEGPGFLEDLTALPLVGPMELRNSRCGSCKRVYKCFDSRLLETPSQWNKKRKVVTCKPEPAEELVFKDKQYLKSTGAVIDGILVKKWKFMFPRHNWIKQYNELNPDNKWIHKSPWFITNATLCRSTDETKLKDSAPEGVPLRECRKWLACQYVAVQPKLIVSLGRVSLGVLLGSQDKAMAVQPNSFVTSSKFGKILFQNHPSAFMREKNAEIRAYGYAKLQNTLELALIEAGLLVDEELFAKTSK